MSEKSHQNFNFSSYPNLEQTKNLLNISKIKDSLLNSSNNTSSLEQAIGNILKPKIFKNNLVTNIENLDNQRENIQNIISSLNQQANTFNSFNNQIKIGLPIDFPLNSISKSVANEIKRMETTRKIAMKQTMDEIKRMETTRKIAIKQTMDEIKRMETTRKIEIKQVLDNLKNMQAFWKRTIDEIKDVPSDPQNRLQNYEDIGSFVVTLKPLGIKYSPEIYKTGVEFIQEKEKELNKAFKENNQLVYTDLLNSCRIYALQIVKHIALYTGTPTKNLEEILKVFKQLEPNLNINLNVKSKPILKDKQKKPHNKSYKLRHNEPSPNHAHAIEALSSTIKPHQWINEDDRLQYYREYKNNNYIQLQLFKQDSTGDLLPLESESALDVLKLFDWKDRKIIRLLMTEALANNGKFFVSARWILERIGDAGDIRIKGKKLTAKEKLEDIERRLHRYKMITIQWRLNYGKKDWSKIPDGTPLHGKFALFIIPVIYYSKDGRSTDLIAEIIPGYWFDLNQEKLKEYTFIPAKLMQIDTSKSWREYAIGEYICVRYRINRKNLKQARNRDLTVTIKALLDEILTPDEIDYALNNTSKGTRLKQGLIKDTENLNKSLNWTFNWRYTADGDSFSEFYNSASFTVKLDSELEIKILGEDSIKLPSHKPKPSLWIEGEQVKALRKKLKLTQATFAQTLGYEQSYISKIERGKEVPSEDFIKIIYHNYKNELGNL